MQVQGDDIRRSKRIHRQGSEEQLVDHLATRGANGSLRLGRWMGRNDDTRAQSGWSQEQIRAVKERTAGSCFWMDRVLVRRLSQADLHLEKIEEIVVLAPHDVGESGEIRDNRAIAILAIQSHHGLAQWNGLRFHVRADRLDRLPQFSEIVAVACPRCPAKGANPLVRMGLEQSGPGPDSFPSLAPCIAMSTDLVQSAVCQWEIRGGWQGALASSLPCAIHIK